MILTILIVLSILVEGKSYSGDTKSPVYPSPPLIIIAMFILVIMENSNSNRQQNEALIVATLIIDTNS